MARPASRMLVVRRGPGMETWMYWGLAGFFLFAAAVGLLVYRRYGGILLLLIAIPSGLLGLAALWFATGQ